MNRFTAVLIICLALFVSALMADAATLADPASTQIETTQDRDYPVAPRFVAEWEPAEGAIVRYSWGQPLSLLANISQQSKLFVIVTAGSQQAAYNSLNSGGANMGNVVFINATTDSYWVRDYGPWTIFDGGEMKIIDTDYNRPRPNDEVIPVTIANFLGLDYYFMPLVHAGGNIMCDGHEAAMSTHLVVEENSNLSLSQIKTLMQQYLGVTDYQIYTDPNNTYIDHIDCWAKLLDVDKVLIRSVPTSHPQYDEIEATVDEWEAKTSGYGTPYRIFRVYTPNNEPYTNSFILNNNIYVPKMNNSNDAAAVAAYQAAMPGYTVTNYYYASYESTDALHCRINTVFDSQMIHVWHVPPSSATANSAIAINAEISHSNPLAENTYVAYRHGASGEWQYADLVYVSGEIWTAEVPTPQYGETLYYYILATDTTERTTKLPLCGAEDPFEILVDVNSLAAPDAAISYVAESGDYVQIEWNSIPNAVYYQIWASDDPVGTFQFLAETTDTNWNDMDLSHDRRFYRVLAADESYFTAK